MLRRFLPYYHHIIYALVAVPIGLYGLIRYDGPPDQDIVANGNHGPLAYSPLLEFLLSAAIFYAAISGIMLVVSVCLLIRRRSHMNILAVAINTCLPIITLMLSVYLWAWLEEG